MFFKALYKLDETAAGSVCASAACAAQARLLSRGSRPTQPPAPSPRRVPALLRAAPHVWNKHRLAPGPAHISILHTQRVSFRGHAFHTGNHHSWSRKVLSLRDVGGRGALVCGGHPTP